MFSYKLTWNLSNWQWKVIYLSVYFVLFCFYFFFFWSLTSCLAGLSTKCGGNIRETRAVVVQIATWRNRPQNKKKNLCIHIRIILEEVVFCSFESNQGTVVISNKIRWKLTHFSTYLQHIHPTYIHKPYLHSNLRLNWRTTLMSFHSFPGYPFDSYRPLVTALAPAAAYGGQVWSLIFQTHAISCMLCSTSTISVNKYFYLTFIVITMPKFSGFYFIIGFRWH